MNVSISLLKAPRDPLLVEGTHRPSGRLWGMWITRHPAVKSNGQTDGHQDGPIIGTKGVHVFIRSGRESFWRGEDWKTFE